MLICLNDLFACSGLTQTCKLLTNFSKNSFYLLPEPLRLGEFLTNYCIFSADIINHVKLIVDSGVYSLYVNGKCLLSITEKIKICKGDSLALILWEDSHNRPISCEISNIQLSKIA